MFTKLKKFFIFLLLLLLTAVSLVSCPSLTEQLPPEVGTLVEQLESLPRKLDRLAQKADDLSEELTDLLRRAAAWLDSLTQPPPPEVTDSSTFAVHFVDVGQADCALVACDGQYMLIDGGNAEDSDLVYTYLKEQNVTHLDYLVATHLHEDHFDALLRYLDTVERGGDAGFDLGEIWGHVLSSAWYEGQGLGSYAGRAERLKNPPAGIGYTELNRGDCFAFGAARMEVLWTGREDVRCNMNDSSVVYKMLCGGQSVLFLGDAEWVCNNDLLENCRESLKSDVVQVGHHGCGNVSRECYEVIGATAYLWPIGPRFWYGESGEGLNTHNTGVIRSRVYMKEIGVKPENVYVNMDRIISLPLPIPLA